MLNFVLKNTIAIGLICSMTTSLHAQTEAEKKADAAKLEKLVNAIISSKEKSENKKNEYEHIQKMKKLELIEKKEEQNRIREEKAEKKKKEDELKRIAAEEKESKNRVFDKEALQRRSDEISLKETLFKIEKKEQEIDVQKELNTRKIRAFNATGKLRKVSHIEVSKMVEELDRITKRSHFILDSTQFSGFTQIGHKRKAYVPASIIESMKSLISLAKVEHLFLKRHLSSETDYDKFVQLREQIKSSKLGFTPVENYNLSLSEDEGAASESADEASAPAQGKEGASASSSSKQVVKNIISGKYVLLREGMNIDNVFMVQRITKDNVYLKVIK